MDFARAFKLPFTDVKRFLLGALIGLIPIVSFALMGYGVHAGLRNDKKLASWKEFGIYFIDGLKALAAVLCYAIPLVLLVALIVLTAAVTERWLFLLFLVLVAPFVLLFFYLSGAIMVRAVKGPWRSAFALGTLVSQTFTMDYFAAFVVSLAISAVSAIIILPFNLAMQASHTLANVLGVAFIPLMAFAYLALIIVAGAVNFPVKLITYNLFAQAIKK